MYDNGLSKRFIETAILVILRVLRRKKWLEPADLTDLRVAFEHNREPDNLSNKIARLLDETILERETKKDTPKKRDD